MAGHQTIVMVAAGAGAAVALVFFLTSANNLLSPAQVISSSNPSFSTIQGQVHEESATLSKNATGNITGISFPIASTQALHRFSSTEELQSFLQQAQSSREELASALQSTGSFFSSGPAPQLATGSGQVNQAVPSASAPAPLPYSSSSQPSLANQPSSGSSTGPAYSTTNVQVTNVDEPDFLKNDGKYVYILSQDKLTIIDAYPAENASIVSKIGLDLPPGQSLQNMFLNNDRLVIFYQDYSQEYAVPQYDYLPQPVYLPKTHAIIMDISDRQNPRVIHDYKVSGNYNDARMVGGYVYLITNTGISDYNHPIVPRVMEGSKVVAMPDIYYFDNPEQNYGFTTVTSIGIFGKDNSTLVSKTFLMDPAGAVYASEKNLYITYQKYMPYNYYQSNSKDRFFKAVVTMLPQGLQEKIRAVDQNDTLASPEKWDIISGLLQDYYNTLTETEKDQLFQNIQNSIAEYDIKMQKDIQKTEIHKIAIGYDGSINYIARGEVPGRLVDQFSMDENGSRFRVATTLDYFSQYKSYHSNNVYVLDDSLKTVGSLEGIAPDESIYAARFMGDRLYLVTFRQIDPFFVIDLSSDQPKVLGQLKLSGFSDYLHPYDQNHIIGIGRDTEENGYGAVQAAGVKIALFDVSNVTSPVTVGTYLIGGIGTDSEVLYDHKALLFSKEKNILSIPVTMTQYVPPLPLGEKSGSSNASTSSPFPPMPEPPIRINPEFWRGFYVFGIDPQHGFTLKAKIEHFNGTDSSTYYAYGSQGDRSFYIGNTLYTVSNNLMKMNSLADPAIQINAIDLGFNGGIVKYYKTPEGNVTNSTAMTGNGSRG